MRPIHLLGSFVLLGGGFWNFAKADLNQTTEKTFKQPKSVKNQKQPQPQRKPVSKQPNKQNKEEILQLEERLKQLKKNQRIVEETEEEGEQPQSEEGEEEGEQPQSEETEKEGEQPQPEETEEEGEQPQSEETEEEGEQPQSEETEEEGEQPQSEESEEEGEQPQSESSPENEPKSPQRSPKSAPKKRGIKKVSQTGTGKEGTVNAQETSSPEPLLPPTTDEPDPIAGQPEIVKACGGAVFLFKNGAPEGLLESVDQTTNVKCLDVSGITPDQLTIINLGEKSDLLKKLSTNITYWTNKLKASHEEMSSIDKDMLQAVTQYLETTKSLPKSGSEPDFYPRIDPDLIRLMFQLSAMVYYNKNASLISANTESDTYKDRRHDADLTVKNLRGEFKKIEDFEKRLDDALKNNNIKFLTKTSTTAQEESDTQRKDKTKNRGTQKQNFGVGMKSTSEETGFHQEHGGTLSGEGETSGSDTGHRKKREKQVTGYHVKSYSPAIVRAAAKEFNALFSNPEDTKSAIDTSKTVTLAAIESKLDALKRKTWRDLLDAESKYRRISDPRIGEFWGKIEARFNKELFGFEPIDVFYRNLTPYKDPLIGRDLIKKKLNKRSKIDGKSIDKTGNEHLSKELSSVMLYREGTANSKKHKIDELIFAFSGSNSEEDWKHNFNAQTARGKATNTFLATGYRVHEGILDSLDESLLENGTKLMSWFRKYADDHTIRGEGKPTLRIAVTGHSLGGALATLMALYLKQSVEPAFRDRINIEVTLYTFGAPPVFAAKSGQTMDFAKKAERLLGKGNIIRVWNVGDPVSTFSLSRDEDEDTSFLMKLLGYRHIGTSVPLTDKEGISSFLDKFRPWSNHLADQYSSLIETNWKELLNKKAKETFTYIQSHGLAKGEILKTAFTEMNDLLRNPTRVMIPLSPIVVNDVDLAMHAEEEPEQLTEKDHTIKNYQKLQEKGYKRGEVGQLKLAKATANDKNLTYTHTLSGGAEIEMNLNRSTSCSLEAVKKAAKKEAAAKKQGNLNNVMEDDWKDLSCGCCLAKNYFVSDDSSFLSKLRTAGGKKISRVEEVYKHCLKYCTSQRFKRGTTFDQATVNTLMGEMGLTDRWEKKGLVRGKK
jgi:Lipase (class 3)